MCVGYCLPCTVNFSSLTIVLDGLLFESILLIVLNTIIYISLCLGLATISEFLVPVPAVFAQFF